MGYMDGEDFTSIRAKGQNESLTTNTEGVLQFEGLVSNSGLGEGFDIMIIDEAQGLHDKSRSQR